MADDYSLIINLFILGFGFVIGRFTQRRQDTLAREREAQREKGE
jgi:hypothetical protein